MELENFAYTFHILLETHLVMKQVYSSLSTWCLDISILYIGLTEAIFAPSEKELLSKSLFIKLHKCETTMLADSVTNFIGLYHDL